MTMLYLTQKMLKRFEIYNVLKHQTRNVTIESSSKPSVDQLSSLDNILQLRILSWAKNE